MSLTIWPSFKFLKSTLTAWQVLTPSWRHCGIREVSLVASSVSRNSSKNNKSFLMQHFQVFKVPFSFAKMGPQKAVVQKVSPFGPHPQELHASFQESPSVLNNFKSIMDSLLMCKCVKSFLPYLLFPSLSMQTFFSSIVLTPELAPGKLTTPAPLLLLLFLVPDDSDTGDTISSGVLVLSSKSMLQNLLVQPGTSLSVHRHLEKKWRVTYI